MLTGTKLSEKRVVGDRFRRIWQVVMEIADHPGHSRRRLADQFNLSERQIQADLIIIRDDIHLPLVRRHGYRFSGEGVATGLGAIDLHEAQLLVMILRKALADKTIPRRRLNSLMDKLPVVFPPHVQPIATTLIDAIRDSETTGQMFTVLADAILTNSLLCLRVQHSDYIATMTIRPELLLPYRRRWYVVGEERKGDYSYTRMVRIDRIATSAEVAAL